MFFAITFRHMRRVLLFTARQCVFMEVNGIIYNSGNLNRTFIYTQTNGSCAISFAHVRFELLLP